MWIATKGESAKSEASITNAAAGARHAARGGPWRRRMMIGGGAHKDRVPPRIVAVSWA
jgi:hypothetical protein